jgi:hypothetical protein
MPDRTKSPEAKEYRKKYLRARQRALGKLARRYRGVYEALLDMECAREGIERKRKWANG